MEEQNEKRTNELNFTQCQQEPKEVQRKEGCIKYKTIRDSGYINT